MGVFTRKPKPVAVRTNWFQLSSGRRPMAFWLEVGKRVSKQRVPRGDMERVRRIVAEVESEWQQRNRLS
jgi:hypothetical protein